MTPEQKERAREATRKWRAANRERANALARASQKKYRAANPEKHRALAKKWKENNPERFAETNKKWRAANRVHINDYSMRQYYKQKYGLTPEERDEMLASQGGKCAVPECGATTPGNKVGWVVDHCHATEKVRGVLCHACNIALGLTKDRPELLRGLACYLER